MWPVYQPFSDQTNLTRDIVKTLLSNYFVPWLVSMDVSLGLQSSLQTPRRVKLCVAAEQGNARCDSAVREFQRCSPVMTATLIQWRQSTLKLRTDTERAAQWPHRQFNVLSAPRPDCSRASLLPVATRTWLMDHSFPQKQ